MNEKLASTIITTNQPTNEEPAGYLLLNKPKGKTSFSLVAALRRRLGVRKIGHAGTLDPFATGVMVLLVGKKYTRMSDKFLCQDKEYTARMHLGVVTDTYDSEGAVVGTSSLIPSVEQFHKILENFQGTINQIPPMFSAKKVRGKKLYELARQGKTIERQPAQVEVFVRLINFDYPFADIHVRCSKGTYIRSLAHDIGELLGCGAHLCELSRVRSGSFQIEDCLDGSLIDDPNVNIAERLHADANF